MSESPTRRVAPVHCGRKVCTKLATYAVGKLDVCGTHVTWALTQQGVCDAPSYGVGHASVTVSARSSWAKVGEW